MVPVLGTFLYDPPPLLEEKGNIMNEKLKNSQMRVKKLVFAAIFTALAYTSTLIIHPKVSFLTFDVKDAIITLASMSFGPVAGVSISGLVALLEFITISETGVYGLIMNFLSSATFAVVSSLIYKYKKTMFGGIIGLVASVFATTAIMLLANIVVTPYFMKSTTEEVLKLIPKILLPFNLLKCVANAGLVIGFYKPISNALKAVGAVKRREEETLRLDKTTVLLLLIAMMITAIAIFIMFGVMA